VNPNDQVLIGLLIVTILSSWDAGKYVW